MSALFQPRLLPDEAATLAYGAEFAALNLRSALVFLHGDLGAGKTTFVRGYLRALGHGGAVKSPTYTLLESYALDVPGGEVAVYHFDFYRIFDPRELDYMGLEELLAETAVKLVEWPSKAGDKLPPADIDVRLSVVERGRRAAATDHR